jgi:hypothetical protein
MPSKQEQNQFRSKMREVGINKAKKIPKIPKSAFGGGKKAYGGKGKRKM